MPAIRHARREGRTHSGLAALFSSSAPAPPASSSSSPSTGNDDSGYASLSTLLGLTPEKPSKGAGGFNADTTPLFLRRRRRSARTDDLVQRGLDASNQLASISNAMSSNGASGGPWETMQIVATGCILLFDTVQAASSYGGPVWDPSMRTRMSLSAPQASPSSGAPVEGHTVRTNKTQCLQLLERVHQIVRALINLLGDAERHGGRVAGSARAFGGGGMPPMMIRAVDQFSATLTVLHEVLREQAGAGLFMRVVRYAETRDRLAECDAGLQQALDVFTVQTSLISDSALGSLRRAQRERHEAVLQALGRKV
ncbi:hypothetical protein DFH07DRAFT_782146 [Mycena maculata]|uniref:Uncharacterized protein n=1 Tax=Mycena maculata TaxID=230809 RepID=A0AAD7MQN1_9AGAR|nr:hypothetical protein DFH07DRAFT_782146 [Mycena maculata]